MAASRRGTAKNQPFPLTSTAREHRLRSSQPRRTTFRNRSYSGGTSSLESKKPSNTLERRLPTVLVLREIDGHPYETIAEMLDLPLGTVRSRLHRARMELREQLKGVLVTE